MCSSVGALPLSLKYGFQAFENFLAGEVSVLFASKVSRGGLGRRALVLLWWWRVSSCLVRWLCGQVRGAWTSISYTLPWRRTCRC